VVPTAVMQPASHAVATEVPTVPLLDLVALVLARCKDDVLDYTTKLGLTSLMPGRIKWCLTVPAIWDPQVRPCRRHRRDAGLADATPPRVAAAASCLRRPSN